ncbi:hypothetical protein ABQF26_10880 [Mycolicibacterium elephantis]
MNIPFAVGSTVAALLMAGLVVTPTPASAEPKQDDDVTETRVFSGFILRSLCQEGVASGSAGFSCTLPDGSVWTCVAYGPHGPDQYLCQREGAAGPGGPVAQLPNVPPPVQTR